MKHQTHEGWYNPQTWCTYLWMTNNQEMHMQALLIVSDNLKSASVAIMKLRRLASAHIEEIWKTCEWCWSDGQAINADVNWNEIYNFYIERLKS